MVIFYKTLTNYKFNVDHSNPQDPKVIYEFGKKTKFNIKQKGRISLRDESLIRLFKSTATMASGISTVFLPRNPNELCDRFNLLLQKNKLEIILMKLLL